MPDSFVIYDISKQKLTLFIPPVDPEEVIWSGLPVLPNEALKKYDVDQVLPATQVNAFLADSNSLSQSTVYAIPHQIADHITFLSFDEKELSLLKTAIEVCRSVKNVHELALLQQANNISSTAHVAVMKAARHAKNEQQLEAIFVKTCMERGLHEQAYHSIIASGTAAATLHYIKNNEPLDGKLNLLIDAGAENNCYAADITRTFPVNGKFSHESRQIYEIVLRMQTECMSMLREGVVWDTVHEQAHRIAIAGLLQLGILKGDPQEIFERRVSVAFLPHGLGHYLGMDTHDTGGNPNYADPDPMFRYLRVRGALPAGCVITVEPGIYFCRFIIEPYLQKPEYSAYIDAAVLEKYWEVGGVRIEGEFTRRRSKADYLLASDDVLVTKDGYEDLTPTPKGIDEIEQLILQE